MRSIHSMAFTAGLGLLALASAAHADCLDFKWDVSKERALYAQAPLSVNAGTDLKSAPAVVADHLYALHLGPQEHVVFAATPGKRVPLSPAFAGLARFKAAPGGDYRISIDAPLWIDVVANGALLAPKDFQGQHACGAPHKIVEFELAAGQTFVVQFSNAAADTALLTITASPERKR